MATEAGLQVKGLNCTRKRMGLREEQICLVTEFYAKDGISWQALGCKDCVIVQQVTNGETYQKDIVKSIHANVVKGASQIIH